MIHSRHFSWLLLISLLFCRVAGPTQAAQPSPFQLAYERWKGEMQKPEMMLDSGARRHSCHPFLEIIALGVPALPEIIDKMSDASDPFSIELEVAIMSIARTYLPAEESRKIRSRNDLRAAWKKWWLDAEKDTTAGFNEHYGRLEQARRDAKPQEASESLKRIAQLGTLALPHLFEHIEKGETDLIPVASNLVNGVIPPTATPAECSAWWKQNKVKWTVPDRRSQ